MALRSTVMHRGRICSEAELLPPESCCGICGFDGPRPILLTLQGSPAVHLLQCPRCHAASASRMPSPATLAAYYAEYYAAHGDEAPKVTFAGPSRMAAHIVRIVGRFPGGAAIRVLDFGGGDGSLAILIARRLIEAGGVTGASIDVIDYARPAATDDRIAIRQIASLAEAPRRQYDLVIASSIMEHIPDVRADFERLFDAIAPGGRLYARTPWIAPLFARLERVRLPFDFTYPAHVHDLGKRFWEGLTGKLGFAPGDLDLIHSRPSIVESGLRESPLRTIAAYLLKAPWYLWPNAYPYVGGWEVVFFRQPAREAL